MTEPQALSKIAEKSSALRFTGDAPVRLRLSEVDLPALSRAFTLQAWVRPGATERGIIVFPEENLGGSSVAFAAGRYDDLAQFRIGKQAIKSLRVPPDYRVVLLTGKDCTGSARTIDNDVISLGDDWNNAAHSLLVFDWSSARQSHAVLYRDADCAGPATVIRLQRYTDASLLWAHCEITPETPKFGSMLIPPGLEVTVYDRVDCKGSWRTFQGEVMDSREWSQSTRSLVLTNAVSPAAETPLAPRVAGSRVQIFTATSGDGLSLDVVQPPSTVLPEQVLFMGTKLNTERWQHIALTFDGRNAVVYLNGRVIPIKLSHSTFDFSANWTMGEGFYGDIGLVSLHRTARSAQALAAGRFDLPQPDELDLVAAWTLDGSDQQQIVELRSGMTNDLPAGGVFWVGAQLPRSVLESGLGRQALSHAKQRSNDAQHQVRVEGEAKLDKAHQKADEKRRQAHLHATARAHAARIEAVRSTSAGANLTLGPDGKEVAPRLTLPNTVWTDLALDSATGLTYLATYCANPIESDIFRLRAAESTIDLILQRQQPIHALTLDATGAHGTKYIYWIEGAGVLCQAPAEPSSAASVLLPGLIPGRDGEWAMAFDSEQQLLFWSNGREIWVGAIHDNQLVDAKILVPHGRSPHPIALAVDDDTGDLFWLDKELEMVRTCNSDGYFVRDLYEALDPREGLALDYFDLSVLTDPKLTEHPAVNLKRLYWNAEVRKLLEVAVIDDPGLFCWLQHLEGQASAHNNIDALEDAHFYGVSWNRELAPTLVPRATPATPGGYLQCFFSTPDNQLHAIYIRAIHDRHINDNDNRVILTFEQWDAATGLRKTVFERKISSNYNYWFMNVDSQGSQFIYHIREDEVPRWEIASLNKCAPLTLEHRGAFIHAGAFSADGKLAVIGGNDAALLVCDSTTGRWLRSLEGHSGQITFLSTYEIDGTQYALSQAQDYTIRKWDLETGLCLQTLKHPNFVPHFEVTPDRKRVVSVSGNRLMVWDLASGSCLQTIETMHPSRINGVKILPDGSSAISYSVEDERSLVKEWNLNTAICLSTFEIPGRVLGGRLSVTADGRRFIDFDWKGAQEVTLPEYWDLPFTGEHDHVDLGPLFLDCKHGFSVEIQLRLETLANEMTLFCLGNGSDGDNISLTVDASGKLAFTVEDHGKRTRIETDGRKPLSAGEWYSISLSVDSVGWGVFQVNGKEAGDVQRVTVPRTCLRLHNQVGRFNQELEGAPSPLQGKIGVLRLWNRVLTSSEVRTFHQAPLSVPKHPLRPYHRSVMEYRNGRPYLVSGMSDGSTPPVPLFELAVDKGLAIQSKSTTAHANLLAAQHAKQAADEKAAADRATAQRDAHDRQSDAQASNQAAHAQAQRKLDAANASAAQQRADAHQRLAAASQLAERKKNAARENARQQKADAEQTAQRIKERAQASADSIKRSANKQLQDAQTDKANQEARRR